MADNNEKIDVDKPEAKPAIKKAAAKKSTVKKTTAKKTTAKKATAKKTTAKKTSAKKTSTKKSSTKKATTKKTTTKKATIKKTTSKKAPAKKVAKKKQVTKVESKLDKIGAETEKQIKSSETEIDRAMKEMANMEVRFLDAQEKMVEFQKILKEKMAIMKENNNKRTKLAVVAARKKITKHKEVVKSYREKQKLALGKLKDAQKTHKEHTKIAEKIEAGKLRAQIEAKRAEIAFLKGLHKMEEKWLKSLKKKPSKK